METVKLAKLSSSPQADEALDRMVKATNEGFTAGRLTKTEFLSWVVLYFESHSFERLIEKIREAHFDQVTYLKSVVKEMEAAQRSGVEGKDLVALLAPLTGAKVGQMTKRKPSSSSSESPRSDEMGIDNK